MSVNYEEERLVMKIARLFQHKKFAEMAAWLVLLAVIIFINYQSNTKNTQANVLNTPVTADGG